MRWVLFVPLLVPGLVWGQETMTKAMDALRAEKQEAFAELQKARERIAEERKALKEEIGTLLREEEGLEAEVRAEERRFERLREERDRLLKAQGEVEEEVRALEGIIRAFAKDLKAYLDQSFTLGEIENKEEVLGRALDEGRFPGFEDLTALVGLALQEIELSRHTVFKEKDFFGPKGEPYKGKVLRVGEVVAYRVDGGEVAPLLASEGRVRALEGKLPWRVRRAVRRFVKGKGRDLYVDPSYGAAFAFVTERPGLYQHLRSGGPIVVPIVIIGLLALGMVIERALYFSKLKVPKGWRDRIIRLARDQDWTGLREALVRMGGHPYAKVLLPLLDERGKGREVLEAALDEALLREGVVLERFLPTLRVLGSIAPLLGLLGTVTGIISTFRAITLYGTGNPRLMAGGISEALVTTEVGLVVAIPVMFLFNHFSSRAERLLAEIEETGLILVRLLGGEGGGDP